MARIPIRNHRRSERNFRSRWYDLPTKSRLSQRWRNYVSDGATTPVGAWPDNLMAQTRRHNFATRPMDRRIPSGAANSKIDRKIHGRFEIDRQIFKWIVWFKERRMDWQMDFTEKHGKVESRLGFAYYDAYFQYWVLYGVINVRCIWVFTNTAKKRRILKVNFDTLPVVEK